MSDRLDTVRARYEAGYRLLSQDIEWLLDEVGRLEKAYWGLSEACKERDEEVRELLAEKDA